MLKCLPFVSLLPMLLLCNCTNVSGDAEAGNKTDVVLMPSISRGTTRGHADSKKKVEEEPSKPAAQAAETSEASKDTQVPTKAQQEAAMAALAKPTANKPQAAPAPVTTPVSVPTPTPSPVAPSPAAAPADADEPVPAPRPNSVELRGFRTPTLPGVLPMDVKG